jgi:hypothetical protein
MGEMGEMKGEKGEKGEKGRWDGVSNVKKAATSLLLIVLIN